MARRYEWNALADQCGNDVDVELVDLVSVEKGGNQLAAPIIQMCFPGVARSSRANALTGSDTNSTPGAARFGGFLENT